MNPAALCLCWDLGLRSGEKSNDSKNMLVIIGGNNTSDGQVQGDKEPSSTIKKGLDMEILKGKKTVLFIVLLHMFYLLFYSIWVAKIGSQEIPRVTGKFTMEYKMRHSKG